MIYSLVLVDDIIAVFSFGDIYRDTFHVLDAVYHMVNLERLVLHTCKLPFQKTGKPTKKEKKTKYMLATNNRQLLLVNSVKESGSKPFC